MELIMSNDKSFDDNKEFFASLGAYINEDSHENQFSVDGEADLHKHLTGCVKHPGHTKFIPVKQFSIHHIPEGYQDELLYNYIKATAELTVRVEVKMISTCRPQYWPSTTVPYPFYELRGKTTLRYGSGEIGVRKFIDGRGYDGRGSELTLLGDKYDSVFVKSTKTCPCDKCRHSESPSTVWWEIFLFTATHVVFDEIEASHTCCRLFYDEECSPVVMIEHFDVHSVDAKQDKCQLKYVTCDPLGEQMYYLLVHKRGLMTKVKKEYTSRSGEKLCFIVSHPHGCSKQVSVGHCTGNHRVDEFNDYIEYTKLTYTTSTCPGSSGAPLIAVGFGADHLHSGALDSTQSCSSIGFYQTKIPQ